jgi:L-asparaginase
MIVLLFTGGTISMRHDPSAGGAVPSLSGRDILALAPAIEQIAAIEIVDFGAYPGPHMTTDRMWALRNEIAKHLARSDISGVVVTHGTDSLEESAYMSARSLKAEKPIVFTGAMRTSSDLSWDGPANLGAAVRVAANKESQGYGVLVTLCDRVFSALDVTKSHTFTVDAFESPGLGPLGIVDDGHVVFRRALPEMPPPITPAALGGPVDIIYAWAGADSRLLDASRRDAAGVIVAGMGRGNVPPAMIDGIDRFHEEGKPVIIASRVQRGRVGETYGYPGGARRLHERGAILAGSRRPQQARIDLMLALGDGMGLSEIRELFEN